MRISLCPFVLVCLLMLGAGGALGDDSAISRQKKPHKGIAGANLGPSETGLRNRIGGRTLLFADFEDKAVDEQIGTGGAEMGEPVSLHFITATVRDTPTPTRSLAIADDDDYYAGWAWFEFMGGEEITGGTVHIAMDLWFPAFEAFELGARERGSAAHKFVDMWFTSDGKVRVGDANSSYIGIIGHYEIGRFIPIEFVQDLDSGTYDVVFDGVTVVDDEPHGITSRGLGSVLIGTLNDQNLEGEIIVDNLHVWVETDTWILDNQLDIKPGSCPNPLNVTVPKGENANGGVLPVAVLGTDEFDVRDIDVSSLGLEGASPLRFSYEDVSGPPSGDGDCACSDVGPDGYTDLTLKFGRLDVVAALGNVSGNDVPLTLTGQMKDGTAIELSDCVKIVPRKGEGGPQLTPSNDSAVTALGRATPNPFNPTTVISYELAGRGLATLKVYDVRGGLVATLVEAKLPAGRYTATWTATGVPSGVYFYRLRVGSFSETRKLVLLK